MIDPSWEAAQREAVGKIITVQGLIEPELLGTTLMHEHLLVDISCNFSEPQGATRRALRNAPVASDILGLLRQDPTGVTIENMTLFDEDLAIAECREFARSGGNSIVELSTPDIGRDPLALRRISSSTGLNIVMGTGAYVEKAHRSWIGEAELESICDLFVQEVLIDAEGTSVRAGIIGEVGTSGIDKSTPGSARLGRRNGVITPEEEKVLRAAARAARVAGVAVNVHISPFVRGAARMLEIVTDEGLPPDRVVLSHIDVIGDYEYHLSIVESGAYAEFDSFRRSYPDSRFGWAGTDPDRVARIAELFAAGYGDRVLVSHDCCLKTHLKAYGGTGYDYISNEVEQMMKSAGMNSQQIATILVDNPKQVLTVRNGIS